MAWLTRPTLTLSLLFAALTQGGEVPASELTNFTSGPSPEVLWALPVGTSDVEEDEIDGISVDNDGNTIISGVFRNKLILGDTEMQSRGEGDVFLASIAPGGTYNWAKHIGGPGDDNTYDVTTDAQGNIYASGWFYGEVDFGGVVLKSGGSQDMFIAKFNPRGDLIWAKNFGGKAGAGGNEIAVLDNGEIAVSAISEGDFIVDGSTHRFGGGRRDSFIIRMTTDGDVLWVRQADGPGMERIRAIAIAPSGDVYAGFEYRGTLRLGNSTLESRGKWDGALARITPGGEVAWVKPVGSPGRDNVRGVGAGEDGSIYASGVLGGKAIMIDREIPKLSRRSNDYVVKVSPDGEPLWLVTMAGPGRSLGAELQSDEQGVVVSALAEGPVKIRRNRETVAVIESPAGQPTSYLAAFDHAGNPRFVYMPSPEGRNAGAFGDVLSVSRNGEYVAQAIRFRSRLSIDGTVLTTASKKDSAAILLQLNGSRGQ